MLCQRASGGSQKTFAARYSSRFSAASARCGSSLINHSLLGSEKPKRSCSRFSSKASEMYLRKMRPRQTCLYSEASMWPRILSAAAQSWASKPRAAPFLELELDADFDLPAIVKVLPNPQPICSWLSGRIERKGGGKFKEEVLVSDGPF